MMHLDTINKSVEVKLGEGVATGNCDWTSSYVDIDNTGFALSAVAGFDGTLTGTTAVVAVPAPAAGTSRQVKEVTVCNQDSIDHNIYLQLNNNGTKRIVMAESSAAQRPADLPAGRYARPCRCYWCNGGSGSALWLHWYTR
jgi:hypothetical protein